MADPNFITQLSTLETITYREDFESALYDLYVNFEPAQREAIRNALRAGTLQFPKQWKNPTDYFRTDLTREQRLRRALLRLSVHGRSADYRDDLCGLAHSYHNLALMGLDADAIFEEVAAMSDNDVASLIRDFYQRPPQSKSLEAFALHVVETPEGPIAER